MEGEYGRGLGEEKVRGNQKGGGGFDESLELLVNCWALETCKESDKELLESIGIEKHLEYFHMTADIFTSRNVN